MNSEFHQVEILCIFLPTGRTFTFRNVLIDVLNETVLQFYYQAMSDSRRKLATFYTKQISGYSVTPDEGYAEKIPKK